MSHGRHSKPRPPRSDTPVLHSGRVARAGRGRDAAARRGHPDASGGGCGTGAALLRLPCLSLSAAGRRQIVALGNEVDERSGEIRALRIELDRVHLIHSELAGEVIRLRDQIADYVVPVPIAPEPIYPSLHLPLVRAAFAEELPPVDAAPESAFG